MIEHRWTKRLFEEFFDQGDAERERGMTVGPLSDRYSVNIASSQIGFIDYLVRPLAKLWAKLIPEGQICVENMESCKEWYQKYSEFAKSHTSDELLELLGQNTPRAKSSSSKDFGFRLMPVETRARKTIANSRQYDYLITRSRNS